MCLSVPAASIPGRQRAPVLLMPGQFFHDLSLGEKLRDGQDLTAFI